MVWRAREGAERDYFNATWRSFAGRALAQEVGTGWTERVHRDDVSACLATCVEHFERRHAFELEYRLRRADGVYRRVRDRAAPYTDSTGAFAGFVGTCEDVDERDAGERIGLDEFFEMSLDNLTVAGFDGYMKRVSPSWTRTLGWTAEELTSRPSIEFVHPEDRERTLAGRDRLIGGTALGPLVNRYLCRDGSHRWFEWRSVANTERGLVYAAARDITEQKQAEERLFEAQARQESLQRQLIFADRMASVGTLAAGVAHEINNPLAVVTANISMIVDDLQTLGPQSPSEQLTGLREMSLDVQAGAERIRKIVRGLKTFGRGGEERRLVFDVHPVLELSIDMTYNEIRHRARLVKDYGKTPLVEADDARLAQVFINLLINAAQALPEGAAAANEIRILTSTDAAGRAVIEVRDTGSGIPSSIIDRVFDPFFTTKPVGVGTGLGLSICHNLVAAIGGEITVTSESGRGATFRIVLPAAQASTRPVAPVPVRPKPIAPRGAVLVVDDEPSVGDVLRRVLRDHDVTAVTTAHEALARLDAGEQFDVILSDLMMPAMSGMELHAEVSRRMPELAARMVFISGGAFTPTAHAFLARVVNERVEKPFDPQHVRDIVERYVKRRRSR